MLCAWSPAKGGKIYVSSGSIFPPFIIGINYISKEFAPLGKVILPIAYLLPAPFLLGIKYESKVFVPLGGVLLSRKVNRKSLSLSPFDLFLFCYSKSALLECNNIIMRMGLMPQWFQCPTS